MSLTYAVANVNGQFDLLIKAIEAISIHAREARKGAIPDHRIVLLANFDQGPDSEEITQYLMLEQRRGIPLVLDAGSKYDIVSIDRNPTQAFIGIFDDAISDGPVDFIEIKV